MDENQWHDASQGSRINGLVDLLRQGTFASLVWSTVREVDGSFVVPIPEATERSAAIVVVLPTQSTAEENWAISEDGEGE